MVESNNAINNTVGASISGVTNTLTVTNPSNTASSAARSTIAVGGGSAGDPSLNFNVSGVTDWEFGIDNSDSDKLKISQGTALGTTDTWIMTTAGERTMPLQPSFSAFQGGDTPNVTGDGTSFILGDTSASGGATLTEIFDQGSNFTPGASGGALFTAPVTGRYFFSWTITAANLTAGHDRGFMDADTTTRGFEGSFGNYFAMSQGGFYRATNTCIASLAAADEVRFLLQVFNGTKTVGIVGTGLPPGAFLTTYISGFLIC